MAGTGTLCAAPPGAPDDGAAADATIVGAAGAGLDCGAAGCAAAGRGPRNEEAVAVVAGDVVVTCCAFFSISAAYSVSFISLPAFRAEPVGA